MGRTCTVCSSAERHEIEASLVSRTASYRDIAVRFALSKTAVSRHVNEGHIAERLARARDDADLIEADELLHHVKALQSKTLNLLLRAEAAGELRTALAGVSQARQNLELLGKLAGQLDERPVVNLHLHPEWIELRGVIVQALESHPTARRDVLAAIQGVSNGHT